MKHFCRMQIFTIQAGFISGFLALAASCTIGTASSTQPAPPKGFKTIFNGRDLSGWHGMPHFDPRKLQAMSEKERTTKMAEWQADFEKHWSVENGELVNDGKGAYATTDIEYEDYELHVEYKMVAKADSGIYLRGNPQVQIWDHTKEGGQWHNGADKGSGGLWNNSAGTPGKYPSELADRQFGEWNSFRIHHVGERVTVYLNGQLVVDDAVMENAWDRKIPLWTRGPIQLQTHGGQIRWRNIYLIEL